MRKNWTKKMSLLLAGAMTVGALGGTMTVSAAETEAEDITYPLQTEDTLSVWSFGDMKPSMTYKDYTESPFHMGLAEKTGVDVEWRFPAEGAEQSQAFNLLLTDEELPDIIFYTRTAAQGQQLIDDGLIYDLTDYLPKYAPDYWAYITDPANAAEFQGLKTEQGRLFNVGFIREAEYNLTFVGPVIRQDWLDECGLEAPVTYDDWENVLRTFKEKYNVAPFGFSMQRWNGYGSSMGSGVGAYGTTYPFFYLDDEQQIQYAQVQPEWKEWMGILNKWYEEGLIDKDSVTMDDAAIRTKVLNNEIGVSYTAMSQLTNWTNDADAEGTGAKWVGFEYPRTEPGAPTCMVQADAVRYQGLGAMISTSCPEEKLITALEFLNYGYTEEGKMYWNYGEEGVSYTLDENGVPQWTDLITNDPDGLMEAVSKYCGSPYSVMSLQLQRFVEMKSVPVAAEAVYTWVENTEAKKHYVPYLSLTDEEQMEYTDKMTPIETRTTEMALKFMTGDESLDNFDSFVEELNSMGLQDCLKIKQQAYERYMQN